MGWKWVVFETFISFLEMFTSCYFAARLFQKEVKDKKDAFILALFAGAGAVLLTAREIGYLPIADYIPAVVIFFLYSFLICRTKGLKAFLWALLNYLLIGCVVIFINSVFSIVTNVSLELLHRGSVSRIMVCVIIRLGQLMLSELVLVFIKRFQEPSVTLKSEFELIGMTAFSIVVLMFLWNMEFELTESRMLYFNVIISLLMLCFNFAVLFLRVLVSRQWHDNRELVAKNEIISMQIRTQSEMNEMYQEMRAWKHEVNTHLYTISGYLLMSEYDKANEYVQKIIGKVNSIEVYSSGNGLIDAVIGSKSTLAKKYGIQLSIDMAVKDDLQISDDHLAVVIGNLYDNSIDSNMKIKDKDERYIDISIIYKDNELLLAFTNPAEEKDKNNKSIWGSTKKSTLEHGFGLKNIDRIVRLYDGYCQREIKNNIFSCRIRIPDIKI